jgi:hypothetical protein
MYAFQYVLTLHGKKKAAAMPSTVKYWDCSKYVQYYFPLPAGSVVAYHVDPDSGRNGVVTRSDQRYGSVKIMTS